MVGRIPESVKGLHNFREFFQLPLQMRVLMRLESVIVSLKYFLDIIINYQARSVVILSSAHKYI